METIENGQRGEPAYPPSAVSQTDDAVVVIVPPLAQVIDRIRQQGEVLGHPVPYQTKWQVVRQDGRSCLVLRIGWESGEQARIYLPPELHRLLDVLEEKDALLLAEGVTEQRQDRVVLDTPLRIENLADELPHARQHL